MSLFSEIILFYIYKMKSFIVDLKTGLSNEKLVLKILRAYFNRDIRHTKYAYSKYDFYDTENLYELKTRNNLFNTFKTTLIAEDKIIDTPKSQYFIFSYTDKLAYIKYDKDVFKNFEIKPFCRDERIDYTDNLKNYIYIPIDTLTIIPTERKHKCMINVDELLY
jgi:hypothetical protein